MVCLDRKPQGLDEVDSVTIDNVGGAKACVQHLIAMGHRQIAMITGNMALANSRDRVKGYKAALREADILVNPELIKEGDYREGTGFRLCYEAFASKERRPSAAIRLQCADDDGRARSLKQTQRSLSGRCCHRIVRRVHESRDFSPGDHGCGPTGLRDWPARRRVAPAPFGRWRARTACAPPLNGRVEGEGVFDACLFSHTVPM